ncbi:hypothetical protein BYT27DRAFT_7163295 [Phlegmacium glaucopus]|nr:hypothetical protein BYT27DRAFT_7163295 [Phlegmacium glaucopus]
MDQNIILELDSMSIQSIQRTSETTPAADRHPLSPMLNSTKTPQLPSPFSTPCRRKNARNNSVTRSRPSQKFLYFVSHLEASDQEA